MLIVKNGHCELWAKSATSAAELASTVAPASMGVFHGLAALKGRQAVVVPVGGGGGGGEDGGSEGGGGGGGGEVGGSEGGGGGVTGGSDGGGVADPPQAMPLTENKDGIVLGVVAVPTSTMLARSPGANVAFHSPGVTFTVASVCVVTPFQAAVIR